MSSILAALLLIVPFADQHPQWNVERLDHPPRIVVVGEITDRHSADLIGGWTYCVNQFDGVATFSHSRHRDLYFSDVWERGGLPLIPKPFFSDLELSR